MNILTYVMTILLLLVSLTYAQLENFHATAGLQTGFIAYMETRERKPISELADTWYHTLKATHRKKAEQPLKEGPKNEKVKANSRLSFHLFLDKEDRDANQDVYQKTRDLAKRLMTVLYGEQEFFKEMAQERPNFLNEIIDELEAASERLPKDVKIDKATLLSKLEFMDKKLEYTFQLMLRGLPKPVPKPVDPTEISNKQDADASELDTTDDETVAIESQEVHAEPGYVSLIDYINVRPYLKVRVFLASRPLLTAIYQDPAIVNHIIAVRDEMYKKVRKDKSEAGTLSKEFEATFSMQGTAATYGLILDFSVTNADPKQYE